MRKIFSLLLFLISLLIEGLLSAAGAGPVELISRADPGLRQAGSTQSLSGGVSADGRYIVFTSNALDLVPGQSDGNGLESGNDVFLYDTIAGTISLVSHAYSSASQTGNGNSSNPRISADGRYVAFQSRATNLVPGVFVLFDTNVFLYDRLSGTVTLVSHTASTTDHGGSGTSPSLSADGSFVAFESYGDHLVDGVVDDNGNSDVFLYDRTTDHSILVSHTAASATTAGSFFSRQAVLSADGHFVAFYSEAPDLATPADVSGVFLFDRLSGSVAPVGANCTSTPPALALSADGGRVAFTSRCPSLFPGQQDNLNSQDAFLFDRASGTTALVSHAAGLPAQAVGGTAVSMDGSGSYVAFESIASNVVAGQVDAAGHYEGDSDLFLYQAATGTSVLVSHTAGSQLEAANYFSLTPQVSGDGSHVLFFRRVVAFTSSASDLQPGDSNGYYDVFAFAADPPPGLDYYTLTPCRLLDTRLSADGPALSSGVVRTLTAAGACGLPPTARAIAGNVTVVGATGLGHLTLYPGDFVSPPATSTINFAAGKTRANQAILELATDGTGTLAVAPFVTGGGTVHLLVDVSGYFQ